MSRSTLEILLTALVLPVLAYTAGGVSVPLANNSPRTFGFQPGEERRYVLEPAQSLSEGDSASWRIIFVGLQGNPPLAVFTIEHEREHPVSEFAEPRHGSLVKTVVAGEVHFNPSGFPVDLVFTAHEQLYGLGQDTWTVRYSYRDGTFLKEVWTYDKRWSINTPIANHRHLDRSVPAGLYLFLPSALRCMAWDPPAGTGGPSGPNGDACEDSDPAFANPGLFNIVLASWFASGADEFDALLFTPLGPDVYPGLRSSGALHSMRPGSMATATAGIPGRWMEGEIDRLADLRRYFEPVRIRTLGATRVAVGPRTVNALQVDVSGTLRSVYVDDDGRVVRADIDPDPIRQRSRWIRLLFPSEY